MTIYGHACAGKWAGSAGVIDPGLSGWLDEWFITCTGWDSAPKRALYTATLTFYLMDARNYTSPAGCRGRYLSGSFRSGRGGKVSSLLAMQLALFPLQFGEELLTVHTLATL